MEGIPPARKGDAEDVVWALQTADALWNRSERVDAIVWLRRAAQAAGEADDDERAVGLARKAAELSEQLALDGSPSSEMESVRPGAASQVDDLLHASAQDFSIDVSADEGLDEQTFRRLPVKPDPAIFRPPPARAPMNSDADYENVTSEYLEPEDAPRESVPNAEQKHAGLLDPWSEPPGPSPAPGPGPDSQQPSTSAKRQPSIASIPIPGGARHKSSPPPPKVYSEEEERDDEVVTSAGRVLLTPSAFPPAGESPTRPKGDIVGEEAVPVSTFEVVESIPQAPPPPPPPAPPPPTRAAPPLPKKPPIPKPPLPARAAKGAQASPPAAAAAAAPQPPPPPKTTEPAAEPVASRAKSEKPIPSQDLEPVAGVDLSAVEAFADLPDDARESFALAAKVSDLARDEEVRHFALAYVMDGEVDATAQMVDAPAVSFKAGSVLRSRGSIDDHLELRLICASETASVAVWLEEDVAPAFKSCPWVEEDLRAAANRAQALCGVTVGPLGERLDRSLRDQVMDRLTLRVLTPGEVVVEKGKPVPGLVVVGVGGLELVDGVVVKETLGSGDFLFADAVLHSGPAPLTARSGKGGAIVMIASRGIAQELLVTCPPLLELFAGM